MIGLFVAMALAGGPVEGPTPPKSTGGSIASLFSADDYPTAAANSGEQGNVQVVIHVDDKGAVSSCEIKTSSGYPELDTQTCNIIALRAKFEPARNGMGEPIAGEITKTVDWRLARGPSFMPSDPYGSSIILSYGPDKQPQSCRIESTGFAEGKAPDTCPPRMMETLARAALPGIPDGTTSIIASTDFRLSPARRLTLGPGEVLMERSVAEISVDETGHRLSCKQIVAEAPLMPADDLCGQGPGIAYKVRTGADGKPVPFTASIATAMIARVGVRAAH